VEYLIGLLLAIAVVAFSALIGLDRERSFYVTTLIVVASYYVLFAVMGGSSHTLIVEILAASVFCALAVFGFKGNLWLVAVALSGMEYLISFVADSSKIPAYRAGGRVSVWFSMWFSAVGWLCACCRRSIFQMSPALAKQ